MTNHYESIDDCQCRAFEGIRRRLTGSARKMPGRLEWAVAANVIAICYRTSFEQSNLMLLIIVSIT